MRVRGWWTSVVLAGVAVACGDQPTEVVPERQQMTQGPGIIGLATSSSDDGLSITTDKDDYAPGDTVWFTGAGWPANDTLDILLEDEPATHEPHSWWVPVDENGGFRDSTYVVDVGDLGVTFTLTATSRATGRSLTVTFTDANSSINTFSITPTPVAPNGNLTWSAGAICTGPSGGANSCANHGSSVGGPVPNGYTINLLRANGVCGTSGQVFAQVATATTTGGTAGGTTSAPATGGFYAYRTTHPSQEIGSNNWSTVGQGTTPCATIQVQAANQAPTADAGAAYGDQNEGSSFQLDGSGSDDPDGTIATYQWSIESFTDVDGGQCTFDGGVSDGVSPSVTCDDNGTLTVKLVVTDDDGATDDDQAVITVKNVAPTADANGPYSDDEGAAISLTGTGNDAGDNDVLSFEWSVNRSGIDGTGDCVFSPSHTAQNPTITCDDDSEEASGGHFTLTLTVKDDDDGTSVASTVNLTVENVAPVIQPLKAPGTPVDLDLPTTIIIGATLDIKVSYTDEGSNDTHTAKIDCGSGVFGDVNSGDEVASPFQTSCTFGSVGSKTIRVKVTDDDDNNNYHVKTHVISVQYNFEGLFSPVDRPNTMNVSKAGQGIPLKWRLTNYAGEPILDFSPVALGVAVSGLQCTISTTLDQVEEYAGNSGLQNLGDGYYQFNWKTPTSYANSCKAIGLNLGEGSPRGPLAYFNFKK
jgi:hypothetical protein